MIRTVILLDGSQEISVRMTQDQVSILHGIVGEYVNHPRRRPTKFNDLRPSEQAVLRELFESQIEVEHACS